MLFMNHGILKGRDLEGKPWGNHWSWKGNLRYISEKILCSWWKKRSVQSLYQVRWKLRGFPIQPLSSQARAFTVRYARRKSVSREPSIIISYFNLVVIVFYQGGVHNSLLEFHYGVHPRMAQWLPSLHITVHSTQNWQRIPTSTMQ